MADVLLTGAAGFIGFHVAQRLLADGHQVLGLDNLNAYYDPTLKQARLDQLTPHAAFTFEQARRLRPSGDGRAVSSAPPGPGVHLAAQAGVRYSLGTRTHTSTRTWLASSTCSRAAGTTRRAPRLRIVQLRLRRQHAAAVLRARQRGPSGEPLRGDQEGQRADGAHVRPSLRAPDDRPTLLHRLRPVGPARTWPCSCSPRPSSRGEPIDVFNQGQMQRDFRRINQAARR